MIETIFNVIHPFFVQNKWRMYKKDNTLCYSKQSSSNQPDEFIIKHIPKTNEIEITVPLNEVDYKNKFNNTNPDVITNMVVDYVKMHLNYYHSRL
jgi:hypothetical protein